MTPEINDHAPSHIKIDQHDPRGWLNALTTNPNAWMTKQQENAVRWESDTATLTITSRPGMIFLDATLAGPINNSPNRITAILSRPIESLDGMDEWVVKSAAAEALMPNDTNYCVAYNAGEPYYMTKTDLSAWQTTNNIDEFPPNLKSFAAQEPDWFKIIRKMLSANPTTNPTVERTVESILNSWIKSHPHATNEVESNKAREKYVYTLLELGIHTIDMSQVIDQPDVLLTILRSHYPNQWREDLTWEPNTPLDTVYQILRAFSEKSDVDLTSDFVARLNQMGKENIIQAISSKNP